MITGRKNLAPNLAPAQPDLVPGYGWHELKLFNVLAIELHLIKVEELLNTHVGGEKKQIRAQELSRGRTCGEPDGRRCYLGSEPKAPRAVQEYLLGPGGNNNQLIYSTNIYWHCLRHWGYTDEH